MARIWQSGFELNSTALDVEFNNNSGSPSIQTSVVRSGTYAAQINSLSSGVSKHFEINLFAANNDGPIFIRTYFYFSTLPTSNNVIIKLNDAGFTANYYIEVTTGGKLQLKNDSFSQVGSDSAVMNLNQWYRIELKFDRSPAAGSEILEAKLDGTTFATSSTQTLGAGVRFVYLGGNLFSETQTVGNWYIDDVAINDNTGSFQTTYPGSGKIIHLNPNAAGDSNGFAVQVGGTVGAANNFTRVNEVTPDDATSYNGSAILSSEDLFNADNSGISGSDVVNVVAVGVRMGDLVAADATAAFKVEIEKTSGGTKTQSAALIPNGTAWKTNQPSGPSTYPLITYQDPDASNWTQTTLDSLQVGYIQTATNVRTIAISKVWVSVDYTPATVTTTSFAFMRTNTGFWG